MPRNLFRWIPRLGDGPRLPRTNGGPALGSDAGSEAAPKGVRDGLKKGQQALLRAQNFEDGYWCADLLCDTTVDSDTVMLLHALGRGGSPKIARLAKNIARRQLPDGGWNIYPHGPSEISATVKAYWALKLAGRRPDEPAMEKARLQIAELGGIHKVNTYSKFYMALFGVYDWAGVPAIPPEIMLFPKWFYFNIYQMSSWTRAIVIPLSILWAKRPKRTLPPHSRLDELFPDSRRHVPLADVVEDDGLISWTRFFLGWDELLKLVEGRMPGWIRAWALRLAEEWVLERLQNSDGLGAIFPGIVNTLLAMKALGYSDFDPRLAGQIKELEKLEIEDGDELRMAPCFSPVWDSAIALDALGLSGLSPEHPAMVRSTEWVVAQEIRRPGDWQVNNPLGPVGGWAFEFNNAFYADTDDTAMVLMGILHARLPEPLDRARRDAFKRGLDWLLSMQCDNGGWGAFDKNNDKFILTKIPFADHNAMIDPPDADVTARILDCLGRLGCTQKDPFVAKAVAFLKDEQESDGSWYGRWGVNYVYGTWLALQGLRSIGADMESPFVRRAADWLLAAQNDDGGWGERCDTYARPERKGRGPSTPSQTAWGVMGVLAAYGRHHPAVQAGIDRLLKTQREDGGWDETEYTGTGFPSVFYLEYTMYRLTFPVMALGLYRRAIEAKRGAAEEPSIQSA